ncbi:unnamed protein product, partial [Ectocarpus sp. 12 AP-2014]
MEEPRVMVASPTTSDVVGAGSTSDAGYFTPPPSVGQDTTRTKSAATNASRSYADHDGSSGNDGS